MKAVVGYFDPSATEVVADALVTNGFRTENITELISIDDVPEYLEGDPEETASRGWLLGSIIGGMAGAVGGWLGAGLFNIPSVIISVLMGAAAGAVIGGYLSSLYTVRADTQLEMNIHEALGQGKSIILIKVNEEGVDAATAIMERYLSEGVDVYDVPREVVEMA